MTELDNVVSTQKSPLVNFSYGKNLKDNDISFTPGKIYFDTAKQQIWYDDPSGVENFHTRISAKVVEKENISIDDLNATKEEYCHNDIVIIKAEILKGSGIYQRTAYIYNEDSKEWKSLTEKISSDEIYFVNDDTETINSLTDVLKSSYANTNSTIILKVPELVEGAEDYTEEDKTRIKEIVTQMGINNNVVILLNYNDQLFPANYYKKENEHFFTGFLITTEKNLKVLTITYDESKNVLHIDYGYDIISESYPIKIESFTISPNIAEVGTTVDITLDWALNKKPIKLELYDSREEAFVEIDSSLRSILIEGVYVNSPFFGKNSWILRAYDNDEYVESKIELLPGRYGYYGVFSGELEDLDETIIKNGNKTNNLLYDISTKFDVLAEENQYIFFACPVTTLHDYFVLRFKDRETGLYMSMDYIKDVDISDDETTNSWYYIYTSAQKGLGRMYIEVVEDQEVY